MCLGSLNPLRVCFCNQVINVAGWTTPNSAKTRGFQINLRIFQGFKNSPKTQLLIPYAPHILQFLDLIYMEKDMDEVVMKIAVGVLGDLDTLGSYGGPLFNSLFGAKIL
ncbi:hypothetical protein M8C21_028316 [Ambrosia artemisiifolia]|uniref:Importin subunit beta-1/Transportin-1-like TPR repeats domain-containing protein n=1 Tax=Ambrosia artemisiifolia TaxID=4212 RepID=A0AAD5CYH0_AMBAR|nr:hypothetical protein M8C21_028316 [Ambrosia artemisiifolia]